MTKQRREYRIPEIAEICGVETSRIETWIRLEIVREESGRPGLLDDEDLARVRLIHELQEDFGVNDESLPIIFHLLDQLYSLRAALKRVA